MFFTKYHVFKYLKITKMNKPNLNLNQQRYQFENLIINFYPTRNIWEVINPKLPKWNNVLYDVVGYENGYKCFNWAHDHIKHEN